MLRSFRKFKNNIRVASILTLMMFSLITNLGISTSAKAGIFDDVLGRCGIHGEGTIRLRNLLRRNQSVYVEIDKGGKLGGVVGREFNANSTYFDTGICNRDGFRVRVYTPVDCGKTFLMESRYSRVYNEETVYIRENGIEFGVGDALNYFTEGAKSVWSLANAYLAYKKGDYGETLQKVYDAAKPWKPCLTNSPGCPVSPDAFQKLRADRCVAQALSLLKDSPPPPPQACSNTFSPAAFQGRTGKLAFYNEWNMPVTVILYHPNSRSIYNRYTVPPGKNQFLGNNIIVGDNWGVCFENKLGASGFANNLGTISDYNPNYPGGSLFMIQNGRIR